MVRALVEWAAAPAALAVPWVLSPGVPALSVAVVSVLALLVTLLAVRRSRSARADEATDAVVGRHTGVQTVVIALTDPDAAVRPRPRAPTGLACLP